MNLSDGVWASTLCVCVRVWQSECECVALTAKTNVFSSRAEKYATKIVKMA